MAKTLHFELAKIDMENGFEYLIGQLNKQGQKGNYQLLIANALWSQQGFPFCKDFVSINQQCYRADLENVDFVNADEREKSRLKINQWVEDKTQEKIKNLISEGVLTELTRLVLTNAIYFKGDWAGQFDKDRTRDAPFYISPDKTVTAPLMFQKSRLQFGQTDTVQVLKLPYKGDDLSMVILLPREKDGLAKLEESLTAEEVSRLMSLTGPVSIRVFLPKFKMASKFSLSKTLSDMGMPDAFDDKADFSGMNGSKDLYISAVLHKAFVEVNEEGTEAAAATGVVVGLKAMPPRLPEFRADHPFVFIIKDNNTKSILFVGRVTDPTKES